MAEPCGQCAHLIKTVEYLERSLGLTKRLLADAEAALLERATVSAATRSDSAVAEGVTAGETASQDLNTHLHDAARLRPVAEKPYGAYCCSTPCVCGANCGTSPVGEKPALSGDLPLKHRIAGTIIYLKEATREYAYGTGTVGQLMKANADAIDLLLEIMGNCRHRVPITDHCPDCEAMDAESDKYNGPL